MTIPIIIALSIVSGILYRMGGTSFGTKWRDFGVPTLALLSILVLKPLVFNIQTLVAYTLWWVLCFASQTTYFKTKGGDAMWWNWALVGFAFGVSALPLAFVLKWWLGFTLRTIFLVFVITIWSEEINDDVIEEFGRGFLHNASLLFFLL